MDKIKIKCLIKKGGGLPIYKTLLASGADLAASLETPLTLKPQERALISTGVFLEFPPGYEAQIRPRSGLALLKGVTVLNTPGTVDSDYRGELKVLLINLGQEEVTIKAGDRIAQLVISPVVQGEFIQTSKLSSTERGEGGYGSTGI